MPYRMMRGMAFLFMIGLLPACGVGGAGTGTGGGGVSGPSPGGNPPPSGGPAAGVWTWMDGKSQISAPGIYGSLGFPPSAGTPGARYNAASCTGAGGEFWLFGGAGLGAAGTNGLLNDLWRYDGSGWTWVSGSPDPGAPGSYGVLGIPSPANVPGARMGAFLGRAPSGKLWLFGGASFDAGGQEIAYDDLWEFDGTQWTWIAGRSTPGAAPTYQTPGVPSKANTPGARFGTTSWIDLAGALWVFGGQSLAPDGSQPTLGDLWRYDGSGWAWVSGSSTPGQPGVYGTRGSAAPANLPGARSGAAACPDPSGRVWLFGGIGIDAVGTGPLWLNDLWMFDGSLWTWVSGSNLSSSPADYGTQGVAGAGNSPGARTGSALWAAGSGELWLFGGIGYGNLVGSQVTPGQTFFGNMNDLWRFDGTEWTWVAGSNAAEQSGKYGSLGVPSALDTPGGRAPGGSWRDSSGNLWIFGGISWDGSDQNGVLNDLWRYSP